VKDGMFSGALEKFFSGWIADAGFSGNQTRVESLSINY